MDRWPNFFIVGAPKCGTTSLRLWLSDHPNVHVSRYKEPRFYDTDLAARWRISREAYGRLFEDVSDQHVAAGEATPWYLYSQDAVPNIERDVPDAKYVVGVRNPADLAHSIFNQLRLNKTESIPDFAEAWAASPRRRLGLGARRLVAEPRLLDYQSVCALGEQVGRLLSHVPRERVHIVVLDDLAADPVREYGRVLDFLGAPADDRDELPTSNAAFRIRSRAAQRVISLGLKSERVVKGKLGKPPVTSSFMRSVNARNRVPEPRQPLDPKLRAEIEHFFAPDVARLGTLLARDLSSWSSSASA